MEKSACLNWTGLDSGVGSSPLSDAGLPSLTSSLLGAKKHGSSSALPDLLSLSLAPTPNRFANARDKDGQQQQHNVKGGKNLYKTTRSSIFKLAEKLGGESFTL